MSAVPSEYDSDAAIDDLVARETERIVGHIRRRALVAALVQFGVREGATGFVFAPAAGLAEAPAPQMPVATPPPPRGAAPVLLAAPPSPRWNETGIRATPTNPASPADAALARALLARYKGRAAHAVQALRYRLTIPILTSYAADTTVMTEPDRVEIRAALDRPVWTYDQRLSYFMGPKVLRHRLTDGERDRVFATWVARHGAAVVEARAVADVLIAAKAFVETDLAGRNDVQTREIVGNIVDHHLRGLVVDGHTVDMIEDNNVRLYALKPVPQETP